jgi:hypothetical protein
MAVVGVTDVDITTSLPSIEPSTPLPGLPVFEPPASSASSKTPIQSPGLNTFRRHNLDIVFPDDEDEDYGLPLVAPTDTTVQPQSRVSSTESTSSGGLSETLEVRQRISRVPNYDTLSKFSGRMRAQPVTPTRDSDKKKTAQPALSKAPSSKVPAPSTPKSTSRLSTLKKKGMDPLAGIGYSSDIWADEDDYMPVTSTKTGRADRLGTLRTTSAGINGSMPPSRDLPALPYTPGDDEDKERLIGYLESLNMKPNQTIGKSVMRGYNATLARSSRSSPLRSIKNSPARSTAGSPLKSAVGSPLKSGLGTASPGATVEEAIEQKKSIWEPEDDEFAHWPTQQT